MARPGREGVGEVEATKALAILVGGLILLLLVLGLFVYLTLSSPAII